MTILGAYMDKMKQKPPGAGNAMSEYSNAIKTYKEKGSAPNEPVFKSATPFSYDANSDPSYQAALRQATQGAQTATNNATVALGARGIGNSSIAVDRGNQIQQQAIGNVNDTILPQLMSQAYGRYQDQNNNDYRNALANYSVGRDKVGDNQWQQTYDAGRSDQAENLAINKGTLLGDYISPENEKYNTEMLANSAAHRGADPAKQKELHDRNMVLGQMLGKTYDEKTGVWSGGTATRTIAGQTLDSNKQQDHIDLAQALSEMYGVHVDPKNDPALAYKQVAGLVPLNKQKQDFDQAYQTETQKHNFADDAIKNSISRGSQGNSASNAKINQLMDAWKATGKAPAGLESLGVEKGTPYAGQEKPPKVVPIDAKLSSDNRDTVSMDIEETETLAEALNLIQQNKEELTDSDYSALKEEAKKKFAKKY